MAIQDITKPMALDETLQATNQALGGVAKDTSLQATNTALGLLGKDSSLQAIVTALATIGLNTVGNLAQLTTEQKTSLVAAINELMAGKIPNSAIGAANGVAELDANGLVPSSQIPDAVDEVIEGYLYNGTFYEDSAHTKPITGKTGKIYVDLITEKTYRWGGSAYAEISASLALGETSSTAYRGDRGKTAYDHSQDASRVTSAIVEGLYKIGATAQGHISSLSAVQKSDITALGIPGQDTTYNDATQSVHGLMSASDKTKLDGISTGANKVENSSTNGNIKIDNVETQVYDDSSIQDKISTSLTPVSGNPISFTTKSAQLAVDPVITFEPIQDLHGQSKPYPAGGGKNKFKGIFDAALSAWGATYTYDANTDSYTITNIGTAYSNPYVFSDTPKTLSLSAVSITNLGTATNWSIQLYDENANTWRVISAASLTYANIYAKQIRLNYSVIGNGGKFTKVQIEEGSSVTSYAPYENICPISGYDKIEVSSCGHNLWDEIWELGELNASGQNASSTSKIRSKNYIPIVGGQTYYLKLSSASAQVFLCFYDVNKTFISSSTPYQGIFTAPANAKYCRFNCPTTYGTTYNNDMGINYPATETSYVASNKTTDLSESFGQTVYGGTYEPRTGVFTVDRTIVIYDGSSDEQWEVVGAGTIGGYVHRIGISDSVQPNDEAIVGSAFQGISYNNRSFNNLGAGWLGSDKTLGIIFADYTTLSDWQTYLISNPLQVVYKITPFTIQLTPHEISLSEGYAYVSTNGTSIALSYHQGEMASLGDVEELYKTVERDIIRSQHAYSTTEQVVGTWIDGKMIYEKSYSLNLPSSFNAGGGFLIDNDVSYIDALVNGFGSAVATDGSMVVMGGLSAIPDWFVNIHRNSAGQLILYCYSSVTSVLCNGKAFITIQYTKTTD